MTHHLRSLTRAVFGALAAVTLMLVCATPGQAQTHDWGDAPNSYGTTSGASGASHLVIPNLRLGDLVDTEADGQPSPGADGDDVNGIDDEDGVVFVSAMIAGTTAHITVTAVNETGSAARLVGWLDMNGDGVFDALEAASIPVPSQPGRQSLTLMFTLPATADIDTGGQTYARFRLSTDPGLGSAAPIGALANGEVEDYLISVNPPGLAVSINNYAADLTPGQAVQYTAQVEYSGLIGVSRLVTIPMNPFAFSGVTWTCTANGAASCQDGSPNGTGAAGMGDVSVQVSLDQGGSVVFTIDGALRADYSGATVMVDVSLNTGETASDTDAVLAAPTPAVPTLGEWAMILLCGLLGMIGLQRVRRARAA